LEGGGWPFRGKKPKISSPDYCESAERVMADGGSERNAESTLAKSSFPLYRGFWFKSAEAGTCGVKKKGAVAFVK